MNFPTPDKGAPAVRPCKGRLAYGYSNLAYRPTPAHSIQSNINTNTCLVLRIVIMFFMALCCSTQATTTSAHHTGKPTMKGTIFNQRVVATISSSKIAIFSFFMLHRMLLIIGDLWKRNALK